MRIICLLPPIAVNSSTVPIKAIFPSRKTATLSHNSSTSAISWLARIIVLPCDFNARICSCNDTRPSTSRPAVGSSIEGLRAYDSGNITVNGKIGIQLQSSALQAYIKPMEAVKLFANWHKTVPDFSVSYSFCPSAVLMRITCLLPPIAVKLSKKKYADLSTGQKRRLHLALALIGNPDIIFYQT